ncbi:MAG: DUF2284 domain-containing protein [archaeon]
MIAEINPQDIVFERRIQGLCRKPFYGHPHGCPNYGKKEGCPPGLPLIDKMLDFRSNIYVIYTPFNLGEFAERMKQAHPNWNNRQCYNPRIWQPTARKMHRADVTHFLETHECMIVNGSPEGHGVNLTDLMAKIGITLDWKWPPEHRIENKTYRISLGGRQIQKM